MTWFRQSGQLITLNLRAQEGTLPTEVHRKSRTQSELPRLVIPTDLMFAAFRQLFPAERMVVFGGYKTARGIRATSFVDVTEPKPSVVHVRACPQKLAQALIDLERTGAHLAIWLHSHPGRGISATHPSSIDLNQERLLREHYSPHLLCAIAVADGYLRFWGHAIQGNLDLKWRGRGLQRIAEQDHVYRLSLA